MLKNKQKNYNFKVKITFFLQTQIWNKNPRLWQYSCCINCNLQLYFGPKLTVGARIVSVSDKPSRSDTRTTGQEVYRSHWSRCWSRFNWERERQVVLLHSSICLWSCMCLRFYSQSSRSSKDISFISFLLSFLDCLGSCFDTGVWAKWEKVSS